MDPLMDPIDEPTCSACGMPVSDDDYRIVAQRTADGLLEPVTVALCSRCRATLGLELNG
jgi:hypothetical protein